MCWHRRIAIRKGNRTCYAEWEDCGPFRTDHFQYVFGNERPKQKGNKNMSDVAKEERETRIDTFKIGVLAIAIIVAAVAVPVAVIHYFFNGNPIIFTVAGIAGMAWAYKTGIKEGMRRERDWREHVSLN